MFRKIICAFSCIATGCLLILSGCRQSGKFIIEGSFSVADSTPIELYQLEEQQSVLIDSIYCADGQFKIKDVTENTQLCLLKFFNGQSIYLVVRPGDRIKLSINNSMAEISYYVENSPDSKRIKELLDRQSIVLKQIDQLSSDWLLTRIDTANRLEVDRRYQNLLLSHREYSRKFIHSEPGSLANILALYQNFGRKSQPLFDRYDDLDLFNFVDSILVAKYPETYAVKALNRELTETKEQISQKKFIEKTVIEGRPLPRLECFDISGDTIISDGTQKRPVLLFFWASWNPYSTNELIALNAFKSGPEGKNIDIITFSLDTSEDKLREFITAHHISLPVICDYQYWDSELAGRYAVKQIPSSILANKDGFVVSKNLFSYELLNSINQLSR
jgi:peroxiredoxin